MNQYDKFLVQVNSNDPMNKYVVRHMPLNISKPVCKFLQQCHWKTCKENGGTSTRSC